MLARGMKGERGQKKDKSADREVAKKRKKTTVEEEPEKKIVEDAMVVGRDALEGAKKRKAKKEQRDEQPFAEEATNPLDESETDSSSDSESEEEEEDEYGDLLTPAIDAQILKTLAEIRARDQKIYDSNSSFFSKEELQRAQEEWQRKRSVKKEKPLRLKDYQRERLLKSAKESVEGGENEMESERERENEEMDEQKTSIMTGQDKQPRSFDEELKAREKTHQEEQEEILNAFKMAVSQSSGDEGDEDLLKVRSKTEQEMVNEEEDYKKFLLENLSKNTNAHGTMSEWFHSGNHRDSAPNSDEQFLINYILNRGWIERERKTLPTYDEIVGEHDEVDAEEVEKMERFEEKYNFRFEQPGSDRIITYARNVKGSLRREDNSRREKRLLRKQRKAEEKIRQEEELKRLKNAKKQEIMAKLEKIHAISGNDRILEGEDLLEGDFDEKKHDQMMERLFNEDYYEEGEKTAMTNLEEEEEKQEPVATIKAKKEKVAQSKAKVNKGEEDDQVQDQAQKQTKSTKKLDDYLDEYYGLDYEDIIDGNLHCRFKYQQVEPLSFGLNPEDIFIIDDADLNAHAPLKKLAPYRSQDAVMQDKQKYGNKKRMYQFYNRINQKERELAEQNKKNSSN